ncbi:hypothetical protein ElyMa_000631400 [Elysia marginata]|uniref:Uncharacterized protein n=1 Tax=Elysia marginata TaxID=1093978 RepID=A0AAV4GA26_9GAST|nr:hypothetical protein ElyMa_000631400 [Elysia marginata]
MLPRIYKGNSKRDRRGRNSRGLFAGDRPGEAGQGEWNVWREYRLRGLLLTHNYVLTFKLLGKQSRRSGIFHQSRALGDGRDEKQIEVFELGWNVWVVWRRFEQATAC